MKNFIIIAVILLSAIKISAIYAYPDWTPEQEIQFDKTIVKHGIADWNLIAKETGKTKQQCRDHYWRILFQEEKEQLLNNYISNCQKKDAVCCDVDKLIEQFFGKNRPKKNVKYTINIAKIIPNIRKMRRSSCQNLIYIYLG